MARCFFMAGHGVVPFLWSCFLLVLVSASSKPGHYIVYLGDLDPQQHPDEVTDSHHLLLSTVFGTRQAAEKALLYSYRHGFSGFAATLSSEQVATIAKHPDVISVFPSRRRVLHTTESWDFLGLTGSQDSLYQPHNLGSIWKEADYGNDVIIGHLDTGIWPESRSFSDHGLGPIPKRWKGSCEQPGQDFNSSNCNRKIIGAQYFHKAFDAARGPNTDRRAGGIKSARDAEGHGTHTASTAAGAFVGNASILGYGLGTAKGGAPKARLATYKICWSEGCFDGDILAALDKAIHDGVDVITMSVGGDAVPFYEDAIAIGSYHAVKRGIVVVCSAGNSGPYPGTVTNVAPWILTVAASSQDRTFSSFLTLGNGDMLRGVSASMPTSLVYGMSSSPLVLARDVYAPTSNVTDANLCIGGSLDATKVRGNIVVCLRGGSDRVSKGKEVLRAGGVGMILCNQAEVEEVIADVHVLPAVHLDFSAGKDLYSYIITSSSPYGSISNPFTQLGVQPAPVITAFSSAGPNIITEDILKPDITAPGLDILAAYTGHVPVVNNITVEYNLMSGTSMSCPHVAGVAALLKARHRDWSPAAIYSAIITTGYQLDNSGQSIKDTSGQPATPFQLGGGHINPSAAADPGLVYDISEQDYHQFLCNIGYNQTHIRRVTGEKVGCPKKRGLPTELNYPSIAVSHLLGGRTINRTVTNVGDAAATYTSTLEVPEGVSAFVYPPTLHFSKKGEKLSFRVVFEVEDESMDGRYLFGSLTWKDHKHTVRSPIAIRPTNTCA